MLTFVSKRLLALVPTMLVLAVAVFAMVALAPGDPARFIAGADAPDDQVEVVRQDLGLDEPLVSQYLNYVGDLAHLDLGRSAVTAEPVTDMAWRTLPRTATIAGLALLIAIVLSVPLGTLAALRKGSWPDRLVNGGSALFMSLPPFVIGALLIMLLTTGGLGWLPAVGYVSPTESLGGWLQHAILPALALASLPVAELTRQLRGSLVDNLEEDYVRTARAKGLLRRTVIGKHAGKNAMTAYLTVVGLSVARLTGAAVLVEPMFGIYGFGALGVNAAFRRDLPLLQGVVLINAVIILGANLLVDLAQGLFNPRLRTA